MKPQVTYYKIFPTVAEALACVQSMYDAIEKDGFAPMRLLDPDLTSNPDKWGWKQLWRLTLSQDGHKVEIWTKPTCVEYANPISDLYIDNDTQQILLDNGINTIDDLKFRMKIAPLTNIRNIGPIREELIKRALDEWYMDHAND